MHPVRIKVEGVQCGRCGGQTAIKSTIKAYDIVVRYRKCAACGKNMKIVEKVKVGVA